MTVAVLVESVVKTFGLVRAVDGVSLEIERGVVFGLLGPNGAGKTTLIRVLTTLLRPDAGRAEVAGIDVVAHPAAVRSRIGLAGQYAALDEFLTGRENLEMVGRLYNVGPAEARRRASEVLERIHLDDAADRQVRTYSGGMRRRLDLAASLVGRPEILFLDEPTTGVDPRSRLDLWDLIRELVGEGTTLLLTTQYLEEADRLCNRIAVIDHGHLVSEGTGDELKAKVGSEYLEVHVAPEDLALVKAALEAVSGDEPVTDPATGGVRISAPDGARTLTEAVRRLDEAAIHPEDISLRKPSLDEVFLALTGHGAEETAQPKRRRLANR
jgi:ABC-2 type transport system ATP-binding protein